MADTTENRKKFEVGDIVIVGSRDQIRHCRHGYSPQMFDFAECEATITVAGATGYRIDIDDGYWCWCDKTLFPISDTIKNHDMEPADGIFDILGGIL